MMAKSREQSEQKAAEWAMEAQNRKAAKETTEAEAAHKATLEKRGTSRDSSDGWRGSLAAEAPVGRGYQGTQKGTPASREHGGQEALQITA